ncbi:unnamed protein product [Arctia plantaginis]|uniref:Uncharacterized protein n=1 Tax=Arctia plantaginis TaxID=874455 RepID=A0A8S1A106_ARCPL|nr:unnamed protein product [Arctia plantaginis]
MPSLNAQRSVQQYFHLTGLPYSSPQLPATPHTTTSHNIVTSPATSQAIPATGLPSLAGLSLPSLIVAATQPQTEPCELPSPKDSNIDGKLLNNLAIALQMLILSNILNTSPTDKASDVCKPKIAESPQNNFSPTPTTYSQTHSPTESSYSPFQLSYSPPQTSYSPPQTTYSSQPSYSQPQYSYTQPQNSYSPTQNTYGQNPNSYSPTQSNYSPPQTEYYISQPEQILPSANLVSISNFAEPKLEQTLKRTRNNFDFVSPYEALAKSYSDSSSAYMPSVSRRDFQSPYTMIDTNMDFFPMNDLF